MAVSEINLLFTNPILYYFYEIYTRAVNFSTICAIDCAFH
jgi:hypothetical protein